MQKKQAGDNNLKELFEQFKFHLIYRNKQAKNNNSLNNEYKQLLAQVREDNRVKRAKIRNSQECFKQMHNRSQTPCRPATGLLSRVYKPKPIDAEQIEQIKQNILVIEQEKDGLKTEIANLETSLTHLKKNVAHVRKQVEIQTAKVQKYKHISYLANSIQRQTESVKIINSKSFKQMMQGQEETLGNLKQFKVALHKENEDLENKLLQSQVNKPPKKVAVVEKAFSNEGKGIKIDKKFMASLQELVELFMKKEKEFDQIKSQQTTKIRLKKVQKYYLKQDRIRMHEMIERFEDKYDVKIESLANLIIFIYERLRKECQEMENECIKRNEIKLLLMDDLGNLMSKVQTIGRDEPELVIKADENEQWKKERIFKNSHMLVKVVTLFHNLIGKFKYLFTMAITLSKQKKNFHQILVQIGNMYNPINILLDWTNEEGSNWNNMVTNFSQMEEIIRVYYEGLDVMKREVLGFIFSDLRYTLIFRKQWLEEEIKDGFESGCVLDKIKSIQRRCDEVYDSKMKVYSLLLINCLKALSMNKYEKKMVANSKVNDSLFMSIPKTIKIVNLQQIDQETPRYQEQKVTEVVKFHTESNQIKDETFEIAADPRRIVQKLEKMKNEEGRKFKPITFDNDQVYLYGRKVVLPKYIYD